MAVFAAVFRISSHALPFSFPFLLHVPFHRFSLPSIPMSSFPVLALPFALGPRLPLLGTLLGIRSPPSLSGRNRTAVSTVLPISTQEKLMRLLRPIQVMRLAIILAAKSPDWAMSMATAFPILQLPLQKMTPPPPRQGRSMSIQGRHDHNYSASPELQGNSLVMR